MSTKSLAKLLISATMLWVALAYVDRATLLATIQRSSPMLIATVFIGFSLTQALNAMKWWYIARSANIEVSPMRAIKAIFIGMFANCFGLGTLGGDMLRGMILAHDRPQKTEALASVFADRAFGLAVLSGIGVLAAATIGSSHLEPQFVWSLIGVGTAIMSAWFIGPFVVTRFFPKQSRFRRKLEQVVQVCPKDPLTLSKVFGIAILFHLLQISLIWYIGQTLHPGMPYTAALVAVPFVNIISTLPLSWNGVGVREGALIFFLTPDIVSREEAITLGATWLVAMTLASLCGGIVSVLSKERQAVSQQTNHGVTAKDTP